MYIYMWYMLFFVYIVLFPIYQGYPTCIFQHEYQEIYIYIYISQHMPTYIRDISPKGTQLFPLSLLKEWPTLWPQHRQQQKNPRKKISRWHGRTGQQKLSQRVLISCSIFDKHKFTLVWIYPLSNSCVFDDESLPIWCWCLLEGETALRSIDKHETAWMSHQPRYAAAFDAFGSQKMFFWPQPVWRLITHWVICWTYL